MEVAVDAVVVDCAADGLKNLPRVPIWRPESITPQPVRAGFPCFGAALAGYVEATRDDDAEKNRLCPPSSFGNCLAEWATMNVIGTRNSMSFGSEPDIKDWSTGSRSTPRGSRPSIQARRNSTTLSTECNGIARAEWPTSPD